MKYYILLEGTNDGTDYFDYIKYETINERTGRIINVFTFEKALFFYKNNMPIKNYFFIKSDEIKINTLIMES